MKTVKYKCKENDNQIKYVGEPGENTGEFRFADELGESWIVVGFKDMMKMLRKCGFI